MKGILPPTLEIILKTYCPLPARQGPLRPQQQKIPSCSLSPMPCTKPDSLRGNQTKSSSFGAQADGRKEEQIETLLEVQPDDMTGKHRDREHNPLEQPQVSGDEWLRAALHTHVRGKKHFTNRGWNGPRNITSRRSPCREIGDVSATRDNIEEH